MKAVVLTAYGDLDTLEVRDMPEPHAAKGCIVVRMAGASINPIDWKVRSGAAKDRFPVQFPAIIGRDVSGVVVEVGEGVSTFAEGDRVLGLVKGSYAELVASPVEDWAKLPQGIDLTDAGALPLVLLTGAQLMEEGVNPRAGETVLVTGALGSVGRVAVRSAKMRGAKAWAGVRKSQLDQARELEVEGVVALDDEQGIAKAPIFGGIADTVGGETIGRLFGKLKPGGVIGSVVGVPHGAKEKGIVVHAFMAHPDSAMLARYAGEVAAGRLAIPIARRMPLAEAAEAQRIAQGHAGGKVLLLGTAKE